jgi:hypothetical protein
MPTFISGPLRGNAVLNADIRHSANGRGRHRHFGLID